MNDLSLDKLSFMGIIAQYIHKPAFVGMDADDLEDIFLLVSDLLNAEADAIRNTEPYAVVAIRECERAATTIDTMRYAFVDAFAECYHEKA